MKSKRGKRPYEMKPLWHKGDEVSALTRVGGILTRILTRGMLHLWPYHIHFKSILRQNKKKKKKKKKNYGNSNMISPCKN
jgi:hypothetical protein